MSRLNIRRAVDHIRTGTTAYTPVIELIVNAIEAIGERGAGRGRIDVRILRTGAEDIIERMRNVDGFTVIDDGVGFTLKNRDAFDTFYTDNKASEGGKGFGRFTCLKYFEDVRVESVFKDGEALRRRTFRMGMGEEIIVEESETDIEDGAVGSSVTISRLRSAKFPDKGLDVIARVLVEKLLPYLVDEQTPCPDIVIHDTDTEAAVHLNTYLTEGSDGLIQELPLESATFVLPAGAGFETFRVRVFKFYSPRSQRSKIALVAHRREVTDAALQTYVPEFAEEFYDHRHGGEGSRNFIVKAYVYSDYLDRNVSLERGAFEFSREPDLMRSIGQTQIERPAAEIARDAVGEEIAQRTEKKTIRVREYVADRAPWHAALVRDADLSRLPMQPSPDEMESYLQDLKFKREQAVRHQVADIMASSDGEDLGSKVAEVVDRLSETSKNDLIHYVSLRKCVLDLFGRSLERTADGKYRSEGEVHDIIVPRRRDTDDLSYDDHNLWILDERLNFTTYLTSDKPLNGPGSDRSDLTIFNRKLAHRGDNEPSNPIIIFEFKKPGRDDFTAPAAEDPVQQIIRYANDIREGKYRTPEGRGIRVSESTPFYGYVVCDLTPRVERWLRLEKNFTRMPDGLGWFLWFGNINLYVEVLSWDKVFRDAEMRNKIFFHKLGL